MPPKRSCRRDAARLSGFTTIELVVTMIIIGIMAAFAIGRMDFGSTFAQRAVHDKLKAALEFARKSAVAKRRYVCVEVVGNQVDFSLDSRAPEDSSVFCNGGSTVLLTLPSRDRDCSGTAANVICSTSDAAIGASPASFSFNAEGGASAAVTFTVTGQSDIVVEATTGYVH